MTQLKIQLDSIRNLTVEKLSNVIANSIGTRAKINLCSEDNTILYPEIDFYNLFLLNPNEYKTLKVLNINPINQNQRRNILIDNHKPKYNFDLKILSQYKSNNNSFIKTDMIKDKFINTKEDEVPPLINNNSNSLKGGEYSEMQKFQKIPINSNSKDFEDKNSSFIIKNLKSSISKDNISFNEEEYDNNAKIEHNDNNDNNEHLNPKINYKKYTHNIGNIGSNNNNNFNKKFEFAEISNSHSSNNIKFLELKPNLLSDQMSGVELNIGGNKNKIMVNNKFIKEKNKSSPLLNVLNVQNFKEREAQDEQQTQKLNYNNYLISTKNKNEINQMSDKEGNFPPDKRNFYVEKYKQKEFLKFNHNIEERLNGDKMNVYNIRTGNVPLKQDNAHNENLYMGEDNMEIKEKFVPKTQRVQLEQNDKYNDIRSYSNIMDLDRNIEKK